MKYKVGIVRCEKRENSHLKLHNSEGGLPPGSGFIGFGAERTAGYSESGKEKVGDAPFLQGTVIEVLKASVEGNRVTLTAESEKEIANTYSDFPIISVAANGGGRFLYRFRSVKVSRKKKLQFDMQLPSEREGTPIMPSNFFGIVIQTV